MQRYLILATLAACWVAPALAQSYKTGLIEVEHPWVRATPGGVDFTVGYFRITNSGTVADRLMAGSSASASRFEIHDMNMVDGVMKMRPVADGLPINPGQTIELKPGSSHAMLMGLKQPLRQGQHIKGKLAFEKAGILDIEYSVESPGAPQPERPGMQHQH